MRQRRASNATIGARESRKCSTLISILMLVDASLPPARTCPDLSVLLPGCSCLSEMNDAQHPLPYTCSRNDMPESHIHPTIDPGHGDPAPVQVHLEVVLVRTYPDAGTTCGGIEPPSCGAFAPKLFQRRSTERMNVNKASRRPIASLTSLSVMVPSYLPRQPFKHQPGPR